MYNIDEIIKQITEGMYTSREVTLDLGLMAYYLGLIIIAVDAAAKGRDFDRFSQAFNMLQRARYSVHGTDDQYLWLESAVRWVAKKGSRSLNSKIRAIC